MKDDTNTNNQVAIQLSKSKRLDMFACVSLEDSDFAQEFAWSVVSTKYRAYAVRSMPGNNKKKIQLSRDIMARMIGRDLIKGETVRHKNKNSLDCTRDNLILKGPK